MPNNIVIWKLTQTISLSLSLQFPSSKEIANLKNEIEKRQKEGGTSEQAAAVQASQEEVDRMLTETMAKTAAGIPFEEHDKHELPVATDGSSSSSSKQEDKKDESNSSKSSKASEQQVSWKKGSSCRFRQ